MVIDIEFDFSWKKLLDGRYTEPMKERMVVKAVLKRYLRKHVVWWSR